MPTNQPTSQSINIPIDEINQLIAEFLPLKEVLSLSLVSKNFYELIMSNQFWNRFLKEEYQVDDHENALEVFKTNPAARNQYMFEGNAGQKYLSECIQEAIQNNNLTEIQRAHLQSRIVRQQLTDGIISIKDAMHRSRPAMIKHLNDNALSGIRIGLTVDQVSNFWYTGGHTLYIQNKNFTYEDVRGLNPGQLTGLDIGLKPEQVRHDWYTGGHTHYIKDKNFSYEDVKRLTPGQLTGLDIGLKPEQVRHDWYTGGHTHYIEKKKFTYDDVKRLTPGQLTGLGIGLKPEQVRNDWYTGQHTSYIEDKNFTYDEIKGLTRLELNKLGGKQNHQISSVQNNPFTMFQENKENPNQSRGLSRNFQI